MTRRIFSTTTRFKCPPLTTDLTQQLKLLAHDTTTQVLLDTSLVDGPIAWTTRTSNRRIRLYEGVSSSGRVIWMAKYSIHASLDQIANLSRIQSTCEYRESLKQCHRDVIDGAKLYSILEPNPHEPHQYIGVHWVLQQTESLQDWCFIENHNRIDLEGRRAWIRTFASINLPACPTMERTLGCQRASHVRSSIMFEESRHNGILDVTEYFHGYSWMRTNWETQFRAMTGLIARQFRWHRISIADFLRLQRPTTQRTRCDGCLTRFLWSKRYSCHECDQIVCRACSKEWISTLNGTTVKCRLCHNCIDNKYISSAHHRRRSIAESVRTNRLKPHGRKHQIAFNRRRQSSVLQNGTSTIVLAIPNISSLVDTLVDNEMEDPPKYCPRVEFAKCFTGGSGKLAIVTSPLCDEAAMGKNSTVNAPLFWTESNNQYDDKDDSDDNNSSIASAPWYTDSEFAAQFAIAETTKVAQICTKECRIK